MSERNIPMDAITFNKLLDYLNPEDKAIFIAKLTSQEKMAIEGKLNPVEADKIVNNLNPEATNYLRKNITPEALKFLTARALPKIGHKIVLGYVRKIIGIIFWLHILFVLLSILGNIYPPVAPYVPLIMFLIVGWGILRIIKKIKKWNFSIKSVSQKEQSPKKSDDKKMMETYHRTVEEIERQEEQKRAMENSSIKKDGFFG